MLEPEDNRNGVRVVNDKGRTGTLTGEKDFNRGIPLMPKVGVVYDDDPAHTSWEYQTNLEVIPS